MDVAPALAHKTAGYLHAIAWGLPAYLVYQVLRNYTEGLSFTAPTMFIGFIGLLLNIPANYVLIYGKLGLVITSYSIHYTKLYDDLDGSLLQTVDETAVGQTVLTGSRVDTGDPQLTELTLLLTTVTVGILTGLGYRLLGNAVNTGTGTIITLGGLHHLPVTSAGSHTTFYSRHLSLSPYAYGNMLVT